MKLSALVKKLAKLVTQFKKEGLTNEDHDVSLLSHLVIYRLKRYCEKYQTCDFDITNEARQEFSNIRIKLKEILLVANIDWQHSSIYKLVSDMQSHFPGWKNDSGNIADTKSTDKNNSQLIKEQIQLHVSYFIVNEEDKWNIDELFHFVLTLSDDLVQHAIKTFSERFSKSDTISFLKRKNEDINIKKFISIFQLKKRDFYQTPEELCIFYNCFTAFVWSNVKNYLEIAEAEMTIRGEALLRLMKTSITPYKWSHFISGFSIQPKEVIGQTLQEQIINMTILSDRNGLYSNYIQAFNINKSQVISDFSSFIRALNTIQKLEWGPIIKVFNITKADLPQTTKELIQLILLCQPEARKYFLEMFHFTINNFKINFNEFCAFIAESQFDEKDVTSLIEVLKVSKNDSYFKSNFFDILNSITASNLLYFASIFKLQKSDFYKDDSEFISCFNALNLESKIAFLDMIGVTTKDCFDSPEKSFPVLLANLNRFPINKWHHFLGTFEKKFSDLYQTPFELQVIFKHPDVKVEDWKILFKLSKTDIKEIFPTIPEQRLFFVECLSKKNWQLGLKYFDLMKEDMVIHHDQLFKFLLAVPNRSDWDLFLKEFDFTLYKKLMLNEIKENGVPVTEMSKLKINHFTFSSSNPDKNRVIGYCLVMGYKKELSMRANSLVHDYNPLLYQKGSKDEAAEWFLKFLQSSYRLTETELDQFLKENTKNPTDIKRALLDSRLGDMVKQLIPVAPSRGMMGYIGLTFSLSSSSSSSSNMSQEKAKLEYI